MKKRIKNRIGIKDIAEHAKVSIGTVDRVLHNRGEVAKSTKEHVMNIIDEMGYTPNILAKSLASKKSYKIAILIPDYKNDNPYWKKPLIGIQQASSELRNYNFEIIISPFNINSEKSFTEKSEEIIKTNPDGFIFAPVYYKASLEIVRRCNELNIPYVFFDISIDDCGNLAFFGQDSFKSGYLAARLINYGMPKNSDVMILKLLNKSATFHHLDKRENGFCSFFSSKENKKNITICSLEIEITSKEELNLGLSKAFMSYPSINGVFVTNSRVHKVAKYLEENRIKDLLLIGYDLLDENLHFLEKGTINFLIGQNPEEQGYRSVIALFNHLMNHKPVQKINYSPIDIIMKDNIDYYRNIKI